MSFYNHNWPIVKKYDSKHLSKIAMPLGGIGTGTISLSGRGAFVDWEIANRPAKGYIPGGWPAQACAANPPSPAFIINVQSKDNEPISRLLEGPMDISEYEGSHGCNTHNHGLPRFRNVEFAAAYPMGQVSLSDPDVPVQVRLEAYNPLIPCDSDNSGLPIAVLRYVVKNNSKQPIDVSICGIVPNSIGDQPDGRYAKLKKRGNSKGVLLGNYKDVDDENYGTILVEALGDKNTHCQKFYPELKWGVAKLKFWEHFHKYGKPLVTKSGFPAAVVSQTQELLEPGQESNFVFLLAWHFPNRLTWNCKSMLDETESVNYDKYKNIGNYYTTQFSDAWNVSQKIAKKLPQLETETLAFLKTFCDSDLPDIVKEAALFNISTLRTQTCFRTPNGFFWGFEGCGNTEGSCYGSCSHVWNYERATSFLFGDLAKTMRKAEFLQAINADGSMCFRIGLPERWARTSQIAAADGQMGCIMKLYLEWQLCGDDSFLQELWPAAKKALEFCWVDGGWDADMDGVMEGCQHNTMDVEYFGPNPQMTGWYLGALRAAGEIAEYLSDDNFAKKCKMLFESGSKWMDENLFNGEYYEHLIVPDKNINSKLQLGMGCKDPSKPEFQLGDGCLIDQLVGQYMADICGLGYLVKKANIKKTLKSVIKYNHRKTLRDHFNSVRTFAAGDESGLLMASYPKGRPEVPFPYFTELMTGFEYVAAVQMLQEGMEKQGLKHIKDIRKRYDGLKRNPFDEAECGHHYARAMASWSAVIAMSGFRYSAKEKSMQFIDKAGKYFWSTGYAWGSCDIKYCSGKWSADLKVLFGKLKLNYVMLKNIGKIDFIS